MRWLGHPRHFVGSAVRTVWAENHGPHSGPYEGISNASNTPITHPARRARGGGAVSRPPS